MSTNEVNETATTKANGITSNMILTRLEQRVSINNAKLLLNSAKIQTGIVIENHITLNQEQAKTLCLKLINQGGPSFQVGQALYKEYLM